MKESLAAGKVVELSKIDTFVDGAAVRTVGNYITTNLCYLNFWFNLNKTLL